MSVSGLDADALSLDLSCSREREKLVTRIASQRESEARGESVQCASKSLPRASKSRALSAWCLFGTTQSRSFISVQCARVALFHLQGEETFRRRIQGGDGWHGNASSWMAMHECFSLVFIGHNWSFFGLVVNMASSESPLCLAIWSLLTGPHCGAYSREIT